MTVPTAPTPLLFLDIFKNLTLQFIASFDFHSWVVFPSVYCEFISGNILSMGIMWEGLLTGIVNHIQSSICSGMRCSFLGTAGEDAEKEEPAHDIHPRLMRKHMQSAWHWPWQIASVPLAPSALSASRPHCPVRQSSCHPKFPQLWTDGAHSLTPGRR